MPARPPDPSGVLLVDKPSGPTSFDIVRRVRSMMKVKKAGHTGTLDPIATGLLPVCVGDATKIAGFLTEGDKEYECTMRLGQSTDTQDAAGKVLLERPVAVSLPQLEAALEKFRGLIEQVPPMYSARKVHGTRLYELARKGEEIERAAQKVTIDELRLVEFTSPGLRLFVRSSKGAYMRTLAHDLGEVLGCGGHLRELRRVRAGPFAIEDATPLHILIELQKAGGPAALAKLLHPASRALGHLPELRLDAARAKKLSFGHAPDAADLSALRAGPYPRGRKLRLTSPDGIALAVAEALPDGGLKLLRVLARA
jgi:tRNA pseudouridine55 synthase